MSFSIIKIALLGLMAMLLVVETSGMDHGDWQYFAPLQPSNAQLREYATAYSAVKNSHGLDASSSSSAPRLDDTAFRYQAEDPFLFQTRTVSKPNRDLGKWSSNLVQVRIVLKSFFDNKTNSRAP